MWRSARKRRFGSGSATVASRPAAIAFAATSRDIAVAPAPAGRSGAGALPSEPYQTAEIFCEGERVGYLGKLSYEIQDELDMRVPAYVMEIDLAALKKWYGKEQIFTPLPKFAEEKRDFAFVVDKNITCAQIENGIREACKYVTDVNLFDVYEGIQLGPDKKSMAFSVVFTPQEEELTGEMVEGFVKKILKHLEATLDIRLRA